MFAYFFPQLSQIIILLLAALLPAIFLMRYIYKQDKQEREPAKLLWILVFYGVLAALLAMVLEGTLQMLFIDGMPYTDYNVVFDAFITALMVGLVEEGSKYYLLKRRTWDDYNFNYRFDGVVYAVFVSLGFAAFENIFYVFQYGMTTAIARAFLAVPGHMGFAVLMGAFYGRAKMMDVYGRESRKRVNLVCAYIAPVLMHTFYDTAAMIDSAAAFVVLIGFVIVMYFIVYRLIKRESATDTRIY